MNRKTILGAAFLMLGASPAVAINGTFFAGYGFELVGDASLVGNDLQLTTPMADKAGAGWLTTPITAGTSFSVSFSFSLKNVFPLPPIEEDDLITMADGITFAIQPYGTSLVGGGGGDVGYGGLGAVGSIIQTWGNNRVGLNTSGELFVLIENGDDFELIPVTSPAPVDLGSASLVTGSQIITYNASTHLLSMSGTLTVGGTDYQVSDSVAINLGSHFGNSPLYIGFTGGTGLSYADQRITTFSVTAVPEPAEWALMLAGLGLVGAVARARRRARS